MKRAVLPWLRRPAQSLIVLGVIFAGMWLGHYRGESKALAVTNNARPPASPALTQLADSARKLAGLRTVERQARADLAEVRESLGASTATLSPEQARAALSAVNAAQIAVDLAPTTVALASSATRAAQSAVNLEPAFAGSHTMAAGLISALAAADAAQTTVEATRTAVEAARTAADPTEVFRASRAAAAGLAAAKTAVDAAQTAIDAAQASRAALGGTPQPSAPAGLGQITQGAA